MSEPIKTRRGVYNDLTKSPYVFNSPYGDCFRFPSAKKLEMYTREIESDLIRVGKALDRTGISKRLPAEILHLITRSIYAALYDRIVNR